MNGNLGAVNGNLLEMMFHLDLLYWEVMGHLSLLSDDKKACLCCLESIGGGGCHRIPSRDPYYLMKSMSACLAQV